VVRRRLLRCEDRNVIRRWRPTGTSGSVGCDEGTVVPGWKVRYRYFEGMVLDLARVVTAARAVDVYWETAEEAALRGY
jgi:hypothetical protein